MSTDTLTPFDAKVRFKIKGQNALAKWQQEAIKRGLDSPDGPPESLRFNCRIAQDARDIFSDVALPDGSSLHLHNKAKPQFGKNRHGEAYLTVTLVHSESGEAFCFQWVGDAVPEEMKKVAVMHDEGKRAAAKTVLLELGKARVTPVQPTVPRARSGRDAKAEAARRKELRESGAPKAKRSPRNCQRLTSADLS